MKPNPNECFADWYFDLKKLASKYGISVADRDAWFEVYEIGQTPQEAFYEEYPELK